MRKHAVSLLSLCLLLTMLTPSTAALEYSFAAPVGHEYGKATSVEPVTTADRGEAPNVDRSKNTAMIPPTFGSPTSYLTGTGVSFTEALTDAPTVVSPAIAYTTLTADIYYGDDSLGTLSVPSLNVYVSVYEGTDSAQLAKGAGHFPGTSIWEGNVAIAGHNRGVNCYFGDIHRLAQGDIITLTTKLGTRTYAVTSVSKVSETDTTSLTATLENCVTLYTCVRNEPACRWCVRAVEVA